MSWSDEPENEDRWSEWEGMVDDASSAIQSLVQDFGENSSHKVLGYARQLTQAVISIHKAAGVPHRPAAPVIDVAGDADLANCWADAAAFLDEDEEDDYKEQRETRAAFGAIGKAARKCCDVAERALREVAGEVEEGGSPSASGLAALADSAARLAEWTYIYAESALGHYRANGSMPDADPFGGPMMEMLDYERAEQLAAALVGAHPWQ